MKEFRLLFSVLLLFVISSTLNAQDSFEGVVTYKLTSDGETADFTYFVKDGNMKIDVKGEDDASMIFNSTDKKMLILMPEEKMYMEMPSMSVKAEDEENNNSSFTNTGETKEINGYPSEKWLYKDDESDVEAWLTKELGSFMFFANVIQNAEKPEWQSRLESEGYFPMLIIEKDSDGDVESTMEVTAVEKKSLSEDMFTPPADFQKFSMPGIN